MKKLLFLAAMTAIAAMMTSCDNEKETAIAVTGITVSPEAKTLQPGATLTLIPSIEPRNATDKEVIWDSDNKDVATVGENGLVTAGRIGGEATITVTTRTGGFTATCKITVEAEATETVVYVAGVEMDENWTPYATLWTDGVAQRLSDGDSETNGVAVSGDDVYVAGFVAEIDGHIRRTYATLWINGVAERVGETGYSAAKAVCVSGSDVYVAGLEGVETEGFGGYETYPVIWKNGAVQKLGEIGEAYAVYVSGGDVYVAGYVYDGNSVMHATMWKNGIAQTIGANSSQAYSVHVSGTDVYVSGIEMETDESYNTVYYGFLWKNGVYSRFESSVRAYCVSVSGGDVYVAGAESIDEWGSGSARIWKNGAVQELSETYSYAYGVTVSGGDVYVAGQDATGSDNFHATLWKNGELQVLSDNVSFGYSMAVK